MDIERIATPTPVTSGIGETWTLNSDFLHMGLKPPEYLYDFRCPYVPSYGRDYESAATPSGNVGFHIVGNVA